MWIFDKVLGLIPNSEFLVRLAIEKNLLDDGGDRIMLFQIPQSMGGELERVRAVVEEAIDFAESIGDNVTFARNNLGWGDTMYDLGDYKRAFMYYRKAYQWTTAD